MIHKIKALYDDGRGLEIRAIARELGISRNTVKSVLPIKLLDKLNFLLKMRLP